MWVSVLIYLLAVVLCVVILKSLGYLKRRWKQGKLKDNLDFENQSTEVLSEAQLDKQIKLLEQQRDKISAGFINKTSEEQRNSVERIKKLNEKIQLLKQNVRKSPVNRTAKL